MVVIFSGRAADDSLVFEGGTPTTLGIIDNDSTRATMATDCSPGPITVTPLLLYVETNSQSQAHKHTQVQPAVWCFFLITTLRLFPLLLQRKQFQDEGMLLVAREREREVGANGCKS